MLSLLKFGPLSGKRDPKTRKLKTHIHCLLYGLTRSCMCASNSTSVLSYIYIVHAKTYGPLLKAKLISYEIKYKILIDNL